MPRRVKRRQKIISEAGIEEGWEEVFDYIFPEDEMVKPNLKLLAAAKQWRKQKETSETDESTSDLQESNGEHNIEQRDQPEEKNDQNNGNANDDDSNSINKDSE